MWNFGWQWQESKVVLDRNETKKGSTPTPTHTHTTNIDKIQRYIKIHSRWHFHNPTVTAHHELSALNTCIRFSLVSDFSSPFTQQLQLGGNVTCPLVQLHRVFGSNDAGSMGLEDISSRVCARDIVNGFHRFYCQYPQPNWRWAANTRSIPPIWPGATTCHWRVSAINFWFDCTSGGCMVCSNAWARTLHWSSANVCSTWGPREQLWNWAMARFSRPWICGHARWAQWAQWAQWA